MNPPDHKTTWSRRAFLGVSTVLSATTTGTDMRAAPGAPQKNPPALVDCNLTLGHWPFRYHPGQETSSIPAHVTRLRDRGLTQGWAGSIEGIFYRDTLMANELLLDRCEEYSNGLLLPAFSINPALPAWKADLDWVIAKAGRIMPGRIIRLHPNYHGYALDDPRFLELLAGAASQNIVIQIVAQMEDERTQHPLVQVKPVDFKPLPAALERLPGARIMVLNANRVMSMGALRGTKITLDFAMLEGVGGLENLLKDWPLKQLVFGSHSPIFYPESAQLKLQESELTEAQLKAITCQNAHRLLSV